MAVVLDFEKPIIELENKIEELNKFTSQEDIDLSDEIDKLSKRLENLKREVFSKITPWQRVQLSRHPDRPYLLDYMRMITEDYTEIHGDRHFGDDKALLTGLAKIDGRNVVIVGHQKGRDIDENLKRNFGCAHPEGYRKAMRVMRMAEKYKMPIIALVDTPGAYPGVDAEERGQAEAIAYNLREMAGLTVPIIVIVIGEGGSGGALGIGIGNRVFVMENAYYSVISPEGCAAILWKENSKAPNAAEALRLTAKELLELGIIDGMVPEPLGGAHKDPELAALNLKQVIIDNLKELSTFSGEELAKDRYDKYRQIGFYKE